MTIQTRRDFLSKATIFAALSSSIATAEPEEQEEISKSSISHAEKLAGVSFTEEERAQIAQTIDEQQEIFKKRIEQGFIRNDLQPATVFNPILPETAPKFTLKFDKTLSLPPAGPCPSSDDVELAFAPVWKLCQWLKKRQITSEQLTRLAIKRLKSFNNELNCVITFMNNYALGQARKADKELDQGNWKGPLHGIPWGAKDIIDTAGTKTTWGAEVYKNRVPTKNAVIVERLNDAGAVLTAKLAVGALAYGDIWYGGTCKNPFDITEGSSGSSAGSASATAAGLLPFTLGSETYGSIVSPCMRCGATGLRPTFGRVPRTGVMALCWSLDKVGPICRSVFDTAIILQAINGADSGDCSSVTQPLALPSGQSIKGIRIGYDPSIMKGPTSKADYAALHAARDAGAILIETTIPEINHDLLLIPLLAESAAAFEELTRSNQDDVLSWQDDDAWPNTFRKSWFIPAIEHIQANRVRRKAMEKMDSWMKNSFDVFLSPAFSNLLLITNNTGHPALVLRSSMTKGKPIGTTLIGKLFDEGTICEVGMAIEQNLNIAKQRPSLTSRN